MLPAREHCEKEDADVKPLDTSRSLLLCVACVLGSIRVSDAAMHSTLVADVLHIDQLLAYRSAICPRDIARFVTRLRRSPTYLKLAIGERLLEELPVDDRACPVRPIHGYAYQVGTNDLRRWPGRAAHALEHLMGVEMAKITPTSSKEELKLVQCEAARLFNSYRSGIMDLATEYDIGKKTALLATQYKGKIRPQDWVEASRLMARLLAEWFPIGKDMSDLERIVGYKAEKSSARDEVTYDFIGPLSGVIFYFTLKDGVIASVRLNTVE